MKITAHITEKDIKEAIEAWAMAQGLTQEPEDIEEIIFHVSEGHKSQDPYIISASVNLVIG